MFAVTRELVFGSLTITVKELTVAEVRGWLNEPTLGDAPEFDIITGLLSFDGIGMEEIHRFTDLKKDQVEQLTPSMLKQLAAVIKELNSVFFGEYLTRLNEVRKRIESENSLTKTVVDNPAPTSNVALAH